MTPAEFIRDWWPVVTFLGGGAGLFTGWAGRTLWKISGTVQRTESALVTLDARATKLEAGQAILRKRTHKHANVLQIIIGLTPDAQKLVRLEGDDT